MLNRTESNGFQICNGKWLGDGPRQGRPHARKCSERCDGPGAFMLETKVKSSFCKNPLRDPTDPDKRWTDDRVTRGVANFGDGRRRFGQLPARRLVSA